MKKIFFSYGALTLGLMCLPAPPVQADAHFSFGINLSFQCDGWRFSCNPSCNPCDDWCGPWRCRTAYVVVFPGADGGWAPHTWHAPPPGHPPPKDADRKDEAALRWGYPNLNYSHYQPVSYTPAPERPLAAPPLQPPRYHQPPVAAYPSYHPPAGITFDR